ncbi:MAG: hypothetical protein ACKPKE_20455 [Microcystis panniformis]
MEFGLEFSSRIQAIISQMLINPSYGLSMNLPKVVTVRTRGFHLQFDSAEPIRRAAEIAIGEAAETITAKYGKSRDQLIRELWPNTHTITVTITYFPPNRFGYDLDLGEIDLGEALRATTTPVNIYVETNRERKCMSCGRMLEGFDSLTASQSRAVIAGLSQQSRDLEKNQGYVCRNCGNIYCRVCLERYVFNPQKGASCPNCGGSFGYLT